MRKLVAVVAAVSTIAGVFLAIAPNDLRYGADLVAALLAVVTTDEGRGVNATA